MAIAGMATRRRARRLPASLPLSTASPLDEIPLIVECGNRLLDRLDAKAKSGEVFDLVPELMSFALDVVCRAAMGSDIDHLLPQIARDTPEGERWIMRHMASVVQLPPSVPTLANLRFQRVRARMREVVDSVIQGHRRGDADANTFLGRLLAARDDSGRRAVRNVDH